MSVAGAWWTEEALFEAYGGNLERTLWTAVRTLDEKAALAAGIAAKSRAAGRDRVAERYVVQEEEAVAAAEVLRKHLLRGTLREETGT